ncbi:hypothetical protein K439DRAFT_1392285 [Ramaria rubella]|nr:hypothetical protein K439DRAFT_1392285 [Ramaria rubella]
MDTAFCRLIKGDSRYIIGVQASPIPLADVYQRAPSSCKDIDNCRTLWDIIWSCLATVLLCTWVAIHPNIPGLDEGRFRIALRRLGMFVVALIAPELVVAWAMRQWLAARKIAKQHRGWSQTHGFFALMGGFILVQDSHAPFTLEFDEIDHMSQDGHIDFPNITEKEIKDKSKGDGLSKAFVLIQTIWFALQCVARGVQGLFITELEVVTLAFVTLTLATYGLWWNKPLHIQCPYPVLSKSTTIFLPSQILQTQTHSRFPFPAQRTSSSFSFAESSHTREGSIATPEIKLEWNNGSEGLIITPETEGSDEDRGPPTDKDGDDIKHAAHDTITTVHQFCRWIGNEITNKMVMLRKHVLPLAASYILLPFSIRTSSGTVDIFGKTLTVKEIRISSISTMFIATVFGAIHCIAWLFPFPSNEEQTLWRVASLIVTCAPALEIGLGIFTFGWSNHISGDLRVPVYIFVFSLCLYVFARVTLLVLAFTSLQSLPLSAYQSVQWTTFIPHI